MEELRRPVLRRVLRYARPYWGWLLAALGCAVLSVSLNLYTPILIGEAIDQVVGAGRVDFGRLVPILAELGAVVLGAALFAWLMTTCTNMVTYQTVRDLRVQMFSALERAPLSTLDQHPHGDLISRVINDVDAVSDGLLQGFSQLFTGVVTIAVTLGYMLLINRTIALVVVFITPLSLFVASFIAKRSHSLFREQSRLRGEIGAYVEEMVGGQKVVAAFGREEQCQEEFEEINRRLYESGVKSQFYSSLTNPATRFVNSMVYAAVGIVGALSALSGGLSVGQLSCFLSYANQYTKPFNEISGVVTELQTALASARRIFAILDRKPEPDDAPDAQELPHCQGKVELDGVRFAYDPDRPLIRDLNVTAQPGQRVAIVGPTGCGKTTIINLLMRFYDTDGGEIRVDGVPIQKLRRRALRSLYGMVLQDTWLFEGTVAENIAYGAPDATREQIIQAAKEAHAHSFIKRLPQGYDTVVTGDGGNLSQGQKQLLCIARVMLTQPPMLILDEATSSIDTRTEVRIQKAFARMMEGRTSFIVAHRLSTIQEADNILVMRDGEIIEQGRHTELLEKNGFYAQLYRSQFAPTQE